MDARPPAFYPLAEAPSPEPYPTGRTRMPQAVAGAPKIGWHTNQETRYPFG